MQPDAEPLDERSTQDLAVALGNTDVITACWEPDGQGVVPEGILGGDGAGPAVSVRYHNRHLPNARITTYFFVVDLRDRDTLDEPVSRPFIVQEMTEYFLADGPVTDPTHSEVWTDYTYHETSRAYSTEVAAQDERDRLAEADTVTFYSWDGSRTR